MNTQEISRLLEKYYRGESSEDEELALKRFFLSDNLPEEFIAEKEIFTYYSETAEIPEPSSGFENRIIAAIEDNENNAGMLKVRRGLLAALSVAAGILLLMGSYFLFIHKSEPKDTFSNPELAYAETVKILFDVSIRMNQGAQALEPVIKMQDAASKSLATFNKSTGLINKNLKNLDYFQKVLNIVYSPLDIRTKK
jgi:hypothetical protein